MSEFTTLYVGHFSMCLYAGGKCPKSKIHSIRMSLNVILMCMYILEH